MHEDEIYVNLETLGQGAAVERFNEQWDLALANIKDQNTSATAVREVTLKVKLRPNEDRDRVIVDIECAAKVAPPKTVGSLIYLGKLEGKIVASENNPKQPSLYRDIATAEREA